MRPRSAFGALGVILALVVAILVPLVNPPTPAAAASAADWDPGYIISDEQFYDTDSMTAADVQSFLNGKVASCSSGYTCLKSYSQATTNIAGDRYCNGYQGSSSQSAAQIIDAVARSCGISQRVLLVLLEKEQSLVTSRAPSSWSYTAATGQSCPDTAPCDPRFSGFFYQVYYAARQLEVYRLNPTLFGYRAQRWNNILYNPNGACGTKSVYIQNQATASLYVYTPYTPNDAALANLYGTGDGCSSYGNRNFWRLYTDWFGSTRSYTVLDGFTSFYNARGGANGAIGRPTSDAIYVEENGQGWYQRFSGGNLYGSYQGGTVFVANNVILSEYDRQNGPRGAMGWPNGEQVCIAGVKCTQSFVSATISTSAQYGAHVVWGGMRDYWLGQGGAAGRLGAALNDQLYTQPAAGVAWVQNFEAGVLVQSAAGFQLVPYSRIQQIWSDSGQGAGPLGWPRGAYECVGGDCLQLFTGGVVTDSATFGAHAVTGSFATEWNARGGRAGLGVAYNTALSANGGVIQNFAAGMLTTTGGAPVFVAYGPIQAAWSAAGAQRASYGWPTANQVCEGEFCSQAFQGGAFSSSSWGTYGTFGSIASFWAGQGAAGYGAAINNIRYTDVYNGGWAQHFSKGVITQIRGAQPVFSPYGPIIDMWYRYGAERTWLGWPAAAPVCDANGCTQQFQNGVARSTAGGVSFSAS